MVKKFGDSSVPIIKVEVSAYIIPTDFPESDGTLEWDKTTIVLVRAHGGGKVGLGYTYADTSVAELIQGKLKPVVEGADALSVAGPWQEMQREIRNLGGPGIRVDGNLPVDNALWDLEAQAAESTAGHAVGKAGGDARPVYGSGGFTSYSIEELCDQFVGWVQAAFR